MTSWTRLISGRFSRGFLLGLLFWLASAGSSVAQLDSLGGITGKLSRYERRGPQEKLFLHLDRPLYLSGETMWLKVYAVDGTYSRPLALSSVAYVEVLDARRQPVLQGKVALKNATGQGSFVLPGALPSGTYTVRAYTSWMRNFSPDAYFQNVVTIVNTFAISGAPAVKDSAAAMAADAQFFPEGGHLVKGLSSRVAFKVTDKTGKGVAAQGKILNPQGAVVASFKTLRNGMGSFPLTPALSGASYTAVLTLSQGPTLTRRLPAVQEQGYVLRLQPAEADQLLLTVDATSTQPEMLYLLAHSRQKTAIASQLQLLGGHAAISLDRKKLLDGISHFTLFNASQRPLCERLYFQAPSHRLTIAARPDKAQYTTRDQVSLQLTTTDLLAQPLAANLSMAVYRLDSLNARSAASIEQYLTLSSELRGTIETPEYYFTATGPEAAEAADNLMLTQGWSRFKWEDVLAAAPAPFAHLPEPVAPVVRARLTHADSDRPRTDVITYLSAPSSVVRLSNSRSDKNGIVQFEMSNLYGSQDLVLQTDPQQDSTCRITLLSPFSTRFSTATAPAFTLDSRFQQDYTRRHVQTQVQNIYYAQYRSRYLAQPVDSMAFYGKPDEAYLLDKYTRFKVLEEVMREYVPGVVVRIRKDGFHFLVVNKLNKALFAENPMVLLDGVPVFNVNKIMAMDPLKIQKLDVIDGRYFHGAAMYSGVVSFTTYKGDLEGFQLDPRVLVQQYEGLQQQREFYSPRYETAQQKQSRLPDMRNLLYWNPEINTTAGTARTLDFYTGDQAGRYLVVVQGLSGTGLAGSTSFTFDVKEAL